MMLSLEGNYFDSEFFTGLQLDGGGGSGLHEAASSAYASRDRPLPFLGRIDRTPVWQPNVELQRYGGGRVGRCARERRTRPMDVGGPVDHQSESSKGGGEGATSTTTRPS